MDGLEVRDASYSVGSKAILSDVSLSVAPGETVALLGPSGSGKTTLLRLVAGLDRLSGGRIGFDGSELGAVPAHRRGFGLMFQDHALFPHLDVAGNVAFGLRGQPAGHKRSRVSELLELVGLAGFEARRIDKLSGGERQRVALARALAPAPKLLMLDEPLASLDRALRQRLVMELREILARLGIPAIYVTHDQFEAFAIADRVAILDHGRVVRTGTPHEVWAEPGTEFVARFLGMDNVIHGVRGADGTVTTAWGRFGPLPGEPGPVMLVLASEGANVTHGSGTSLATGQLRRLTFHGSTIVITLEREGTELEFEVPAGSELPSVGETVSITVGRAFIVV